MIMHEVEDIQVPIVDDFTPEYLHELQEDVILDRRTKTSPWGDVQYFQVGLKRVHPSKSEWIEAGRVREFYPHLFANQIKLLEVQKLLSEEE